jgi:cytochrome subunit of sulfide dehydrogenase
MHIKITATILLFFSSLVVSATGLAVEISQAAMLANSCAGCHGTYGKSPGAIPAINGKSASFIVESLKDFQSGARPSTVMGRHANGYSDQEIQLIAEFFSKH